MYIRMYVYVFMCMFTGVCIQNDVDEFVRLGQTHRTTSAAHHRAEGETTATGATTAVVAG